MEFTIAHRSEQNEANVWRKAACSMRAMAAGEVAQAIAKLPSGSQISASGFLTQASRTNSALVLHVLNFELIE